MFNSFLNFFSMIWDTIEDFIILLIVIAYTILFFVVQYYLIKGYIWIGKTLYNLYELKFNKETQEISD